MDLLRIYQTESRGFRLVGELDLSCLDLLEPLEELAGSGGDIRVDLARLRFVDGAGMERFAHLAKSLRPAKLVVLRPQKPVERQLRRMCGAEKLDNVLISRLDAGVADTFETQNLPRELDMIIVSDYSPEAVCGLITELAVTTVDGATAAAVAVRNSGHPTCAAASNELGGAGANLEIQLGEGPILDTLRLGRRQSSSSLVTEKRWREFTTSALYAGVASVMAEPLPAHGSTFGVLALYSPRENAFTEASFCQAAGLASRAAVVLANANLYWQATELADQLKEALESRAAIDQAKGILMARESVSPEEAFAMLLRASQAGNLKVRDIALKLINEAQAVPSKGIVA